jgi:hypothetical protein
MDIAGRTEMIVNFPTKSLTHTCENISSSDDIFDDDRVLVTVWDDEENSPVSVCEFSPCPIGTDTRLPYEVNVIDLNNSQIFTSMVEVPLSISFEYTPDLFRWSNLIWLTSNCLHSNRCSWRWEHSHAANAVQRRC